MVSAAVVGLGRIGLGYDLESSPEQVFSHTKSILVHPAFELVGGVDPDPVRRREFEQFSSARAYATIEDLTSEIRPDVLAVAVPTSEHLRTVERIVEIFSPRLLLIEKPVTGNVSNAERIGALAEKSNILLMVNYMRRFEPRHREFAARFKREEYGKALAGTIYYSKGLYNSCSHYLSLCIEWFGRPDGIISIPGPLDQDPDLDFVMRYGAFSICVQAGREDNYSIGEIDLLFEKARVRFSGFCERIELYTVVEDPAFRGLHRLRTEPLLVEPEMSRYQYHVYEAVFRALDEGRACGYDNALDTLRVCEAAVQNSRRS